MWNEVKAWFASKGGFSHVVAGLFASAVLAYSLVPSFASLLNSIYALIPAWGHEVILAALGLYAWYKKQGNTILSSSTVTTKKTTELIDGAE
jgi:hypothetical protein